MEPTAHRSLDSSSLAAITSSQLFQDYQRAFEVATGLPLSLSSPTELAHAGPRPGTDVPFCSLMAENSAACVACQQVHESLEQEAHKAPRTLTCFAGLCETAIPVRIGEKLIAFLHTGQVMTQEPTKARFSKVASALLKWGSEVDLKRAEDAWFATRVLSEEQYAGLVKLITIFATHLSACGRLLVEEAAPQEPDGIKRARAFIAERSDQELTLHSVAKVANMSANYFSEKFKEITGIRFVEYVARTRIEKACHLLRSTALPVTEVAYEVGFKTKFLWALALVIAAASLASCQTTSVAGAESAVMCDKCKTVWVKTPAYPNITGRTVTVFRDHQVMQCPDCEKAYVTFFRTGSLKHHCSHCGGTLTHCTAH